MLSKQHCPTVWKIRHVISDKNGSGSLIMKILLWKYMDQQCSVVLQNAEHLHSNDKHCPLLNICTVMTNTVHCCQTPIHYSKSFCTHVCGSVFSWTEIVDEVIGTSDMVLINSSIARQLLLWIWTLDIPFKVVSLALVHAVSSFLLYTCVFTGRGSSWLDRATSTEGIWKQKTNKMHMMQLYCCMLRVKIKSSVLHTFIWKPFNQSCRFNCCYCCNELHTYCLVLGTKLNHYIHNMYQPQNSHKTAQFIATQQKIVQFGILSNDLSIKLA